MVISELLREGQNVLQEAGIAGYELDSVILLGHCLELSRTELYLHGAEQVSNSSCTRFREYIKRRKDHEPIAYILEEKEFWSLNFIVNNHVLIPRPETEFLLEIVFQQLNKRSLTVSHCVDLCCGSGVIAVVLAHELKSKVIAIDCSLEASAVTRKNCIKHNVSDRVDVICSDLFTALGRFAKYDLIVSNPPYVSSGAIQYELDAEVAEFEPKLALDGGSDGLDCIQRIAHEVIAYLAPSGVFAMEFGADQGERVKSIFLETSREGRHFEDVTIFKDYSGRDRVLIAQINAYT